MNAGNSKPSQIVRKGILLAGGLGTRLHPLTLGTSKQLLPVFDKPLIYYPLTVLMMAGVREILIITTPQEEGAFKRLLGNGSQWGISLSYANQEKPKGIADALRIGRNFLEGKPSVLILGDNIFFGHGLLTKLQQAALNPGATIFASQVRDPRRFGVVELGKDFQPLSIEEKPPEPKSPWAVTGLYFLDAKAPDITDRIAPSPRGELEIISVLQHYLDANSLKAELLHRGFAWLDAGTHEALHQAGEFVRTLQDRQGLLVSSPEEIAYRLGLITLNQLAKQAARYAQSSYGKSLSDFAKQESLHA